MGALFCLFGAIFPLVRGELFTALVHMEGLVELEGELTSKLRSYIRREKDRLRELERWNVHLFVAETCTFVSAIIDRGKDALYAATSSSWVTHGGSCVYCCIVGVMSHSDMVS